MGVAVLALGFTGLVAAVAPAEAGGQTPAISPTTTVAALVPAPATTVAPAGDNKSSRTVNRIVAALIGLAVLVLGVTIWFWRTTKPKPSWLEGLDALGSRRWRRADPGGRAALLASVHERHGELREKDLIVPAEPVVPVAAEPSKSVDPVDPAAGEGVAEPAAVEGEPDDVDGVVAPATVSGDD